LFLVQTENVSSHLFLTEKATTVVSLR